MANTEQSVPLLIVLQFTCEKGEMIGQLRGCHREMASYFTDENGIITRRLGSDDTAVDFPASDLAKYLGDNAATFVSQLEAERADNDATKQKLLAVQAQAEELAEQLMQANSKIETLMAAAKAAPENATA